MAVPKKISAAARRVARELGLTANAQTSAWLWYVPINNPVVIGYAALPDATVDEMPATEVQITLLDDTSTAVSCTLKRSGKGEKLYWIVTTQGAGAVWYRWTDPQGNIHDFVAHGDNEQDTAEGRQATAERSRKLQTVWKVMFESGRPQTVVEGVCDAVKNRRNIALVTFRFVDHLLAAHGGNVDDTRTELEGWQAASPTDRHLLHKLTKAGANKPVPETVRAILRGAHHALRNDEQ